MTPLRRPAAWAALAAGFVRELVVSTIDTVAAVLGDHRKLKPAILEVPLDVKSDAGITLFADMVTLTPGTTSIDVAEDKSRLYVHALDVKDADASVAALKKSLEARVRRVLP